MTYPTSPAPPSTYGQTSGEWPVVSDPGDRAIRPDGLAAVLMILGGAVGIAQLWLAWLSQAGTSVTGWDVFQSLKHGLSVHAGVAATLGAYSVLAVLVLGVALVLLGVLMLVRLDHRPPGVVAAVAGLLGVLCALWWVFWHGGAGGLGAMFSAGGVGWYLFLVSGLLGLVGAIKALVSST